MSQRAATDETILRFVQKKQPLGGGRIGAADDLDGAVVYFLSDESRYATGQVLSIDRGWSVSDAASDASEDAS
jgi:NAD(P)-dependent dehydrogenase (short-subunit alcohol dehydrogenase family)